MIGQAVEALGGGAGYVGCGMLGGVLAWLLFKHLPAKDAQLERMIQSRDEAITELVRGRDDLLRDMVAIHDKRLEAVYKWASERKPGQSS